MGQAGFLIVAPVFDLGFSRGGGFFVGMKFVPDQRYYFGAVRGVIAFAFGVVADLILQVCSDSAVVTAVGAE